MLVLLLLWPMQTIQFRVDGLYQDREVTLTVLDVVFGGFLPPSKLLSSTTLDEVVGLLHHPLGMVISDNPHGEDSVVLP